MGFGLSPWRICSRMRSARRRAMRLTPRGAFGTTILMARENIANALGPVVDGLANILELARTIRAARFVYISSGAVYGAGAAADQTCSEDLPAAPDFLYGITKYAGELLSRRYGELHGFPAVSVRLSTPYGPMERPTGHRAVMSVLYQWTGQAVRGEPLSPDDLDGGRDYIYVVDAARGIRRILNAPNLPHDLYNLTGGVWINNREIVATLTQLAPASATPPAAPSSPTPPVGAPSRGPLSPHRLRQDLGWQPEYDLRAALADYLHWWRESGFDG